jgi:hypothetical protein
MSPQTPVPSAPPVPAAPVEAQVAQGPATLSGLQAQAIELRIQLAGIRAQWNGLRTQLDQMLRNNPARPGVQQKWADVGVQKAQVEGDLARIEAQIAQLTGTPVAGVRPPLPRGSRFNPSIGIPIGAVLVMVMFVPVSLAWARRIARGSNRPAPLTRDAVDRLERLEQAIDTVAIEVERISEGQRFVTKILAERPKRTDSAAEASRDAAPDEPHIRALGAGSAEPIEVPQREQVREQA